MTATPPTLPPDLADSSRTATARRGLWRQPVWLALMAALVIVIAAFVPAVWQMNQRGHGLAPQAHDAPWESDITADGAVRALGLRIPGATLADVQALWPDGLQVALMTGRNGVTALEASVETARPGGIAGRLIVSAEATPAQLLRWRSAGQKEERVSAETLRINLQGLEREQALQAPVTAIGFIPQIQMEPALVRQRFGEPAQIVRESATVEHWFYPARGLALVLDSQARDLLQFVPPAQFDRRLRQPVVAHAARAASSPATP